MNDLDLIRRFRSDVPPPDAHRIGRARERLTAVASDRPERRRVPMVLRGRSSLVALVAGPLVAVVVLLVIAGAASETGSGIADAAIIHRADAALAAPPNMILHAVVAGDGVGAESWQLTSPPYSFVAMKGSLGHEQEQADNGTTSSVYDPSTNTIDEHTGGAPITFDDPLAQVRQALHDGRARVLGSATIDGHSTYKIQFTDKSGFTDQSLIAYVDKGTYRPILLSDPQRDGTTVQLRVLVLEYLPRTPANERLLSLTDRHPRARVVIDSTSKPQPSK